MPLVFNSLRGGHTDIHTHTDNRIKVISRNQARAGSRLAHAWFKNHYGLVFRPNTEKHTYTITYIGIHKHTHTHLHIHKQTNTNTYIYIHTHTHAYIHIHIQTHTYGTAQR